MSWTLLIVGNRDINPEKAGMGRVIRGWDEAIMQMTVGQTAGVFIQAPWVRQQQNIAGVKMVFIGIWQEGLPRSWHSTKPRLVF